MCIDQDPHWYSRKIKEAIHLTQDFTPAISTGTVELRFLKRGCLRSDNMAADPIPTTMDC